MWHNSIIIVAFINVRSLLLMLVALPLLYNQYLWQFECKEFVFCIRQEGEQEGNESKPYSKILNKK